MTEEEFIPKKYDQGPEIGKVSWEAPSNIALVKYWGKKPNQIPANPSLSFTLNTSKTITTVQFEKRKNLEENFDFEVVFEGNIKESFRPKIQKFFERIVKYLPFLKNYSFRIETRNTFPHSSGIASSASGMSALALCLMSIEKLINPEISSEYFNQKASFLARLGSGSACRSIQSKIVVWGKTESIKNSSDLYGIQYPYEVHPVFKDFQDTILLIEKGEKQVSSSLGHNLMENHPFAAARFNQAHRHLEEIKEILKTGDLSAFIALVESEALTLHAMMMTSNPYFLLMKPNTLAVINKVFEFREKTKLHLCFTLDAGANVHLLYPKNEQKEILNFINNDLIIFCQNGEFIEDQMGSGAKEIFI